MALQTFEVSTTVKNGDTVEERSASFEYDIPGSLGEIIEKYGDKTVCEEFQANMRNKIHDPARKVLAKMAPGTTQPEWNSAVQNFMRSFVFGQKMARGATTRAASDPARELAALLPTLPADERKEMLLILGIPENVVETLVSQLTMQVAMQATEQDAEHTALDEQSSDEIPRRPRRSVVA